MGAAVGAMPVRNRYGVDFLCRQSRRNQGSNFREFWIHARNSLWIGGQISYTCVMSTLGIVSPSPGSLASSPNQLK